MGLDGVEIFTNSSASHHELRKLNRRVELIKEATMKVSCGYAAAQLTPQLGGIYLYANQQGCDGDRLYYDGASLIALNGQILARGTQFSLNEVEVVTATIDLEAVRAHRTGSSRRMQAAQTEPFERYYVDTRLDGGQGLRIGEEETKAPGKVDIVYHTPEEEIAWVLRRSLTHADGQARPRMLALGLPPSLEDAGILRPLEWWYRLVRNGRHRPLDVPSCCQGCGRGK